MSSDLSRPEIVVSARNVGKCYHLYANPKDRLKQTLWRGRRQFYREFWALRDVSFDLRKGESVGIIGRNGSGKSTLLQILAGILQPTEGQMTVHGRVTALLELGSGFNPEFTGRENIRMQAAILGFSAEQIEARMEDIQAFADIGDFIDQPVKTYSSGMYVRVAFAVQILLEPDILIVDEALAVGDAAFQVKCMSHMQRLMKGGVAILLVTHDVNTVRSFCHRAIWLRDGRVAMEGETREVTGRYLEYLFSPPASATAVSTSATVAAPSAESANERDEAGGAAVTAAPAAAVRELDPLSQRKDLIRWGSGEMVVTGVAMDSGVPGGADVFEHRCPLHVELEVTVCRPVTSPNVGVGFSFRNTKGLDIITFTTWEAGMRFPDFETGRRYRLAFDLENILAAGDYALVVNLEYVSSSRRTYLDFIENALLFRVLSQYPIWSLTLPKVSHRLMCSNAGSSRPYGTTP